MIDSLEENVEIKRVSLVEAKLHINEICEFIYESVTMSNYEESYTRKQAMEKATELCGYIEEEKAIVVGAFTNEKMVGFLWSYRYPFREDVNRLYISILHVLSEYRNYSIGTKLINYVEKIAKNLNVDRIYLHAEASSRQACGFYEKNKFTKERIQYVKEIKEDK